MADTISGRPFIVNMKMNAVFIFYPADLTEFSFVLHYPLISHGYAALNLFEKNGGKKASKN
jgi:hypothetical protein